MNGRKEKLRRVGLVLLIIGAFCAAVAMLFGARFENIPPELVLRSKRPARAASAESAMSADGRYEISAKGIHSVKVEWASGRVEVISTDGEQITLEEHANRALDESTALQWRAEDGILTVSYCKGQTLGPQKELKLTIPEKLEKELEISTASADVIVSGLEADEFYIDTASGDILLAEDCRCRELSLSTSSGSIRADADCTAAELDTASGDITFAPRQRLTELDISTSSGEVSFAGAFREGELETASGDVRLTLTEAFDELEIESSSGDIRMNVGKNVGFFIDYSTGSGDFDSNLPVVLQDKRMRIGDGNGRLTVDTGSGDLTILNYPEHK